MILAFIGCGQVGGALADQLQRCGHRVILATRNPDSESVSAARELNPALETAAPVDACRLADVVFLATPFQANASALEGLADVLKGKTLVDCTNPVGPGLKHGLDSRESGSEQVQRLAPGALVVKAFTIYGFENFKDPVYPQAGEQPAMLIAGDSQTAKHQVSQLCEQLGWKPVDVGPLSSALHLEHMTLLWIKMARLQGKGPNFVWAMLER
jgi:hypothetical protein